MIGFLRRYWLDLCLMVCALGAVLAVLLTTGKATTSELKSRENRVLGVFRPEELRRMVFEQKGRKVVLERKPSPDREWQIVEPIREAARASAVSELMHALELGRRVRQIPPESVHRAELGLDAPRAVVMLESATVSYRLVLGKAAASPRGSAYLELAGESAPGKGVLLIEADLAQQLERDLDGWREPALVPYRPDELVQLILEGAGGTRRLRRQKARWRFDGMEQDRLADRRALDLMLLGMGKLEAEHALDPAEAERALSGQSVVRLTLVPTESRAASVLELGGQCPKNSAQMVVLRQKPDRRAGCVDRELFRTFSLPAEALVHRRLFTLRPDEVERLSIQAGERRLELERQGSGFVLRAPREAPVSSAAGNQRLEAILDAQAWLVHDADLTPLGLTHPRGRVTVSSAAASQAEVVEESLLVGAPDTRNRLHGLRQVDGAVFLLDPVTARALEVDTTLLRSLELWQRSPKEVRTVEIRGRDREIRLLQPSAGGFELALPQGFAVDAGLASELTEALAELTVERWVTDQDDGSHGLGQPEFDVRIETEGSGGRLLEHRLMVGHPTSGGAFAASGEGSGVFVLPRKTLNLLRLLPIDRSLLMVDTSAATRITLEARGGEKLVLGRTGSEFERVQGKAELGPTGLAELLEALGTLRAEVAVHTGPERREEGLAMPALVVEVAYPEGHTPARQRIRFGAVDAWQDSTVRYARADGVEATFVVLKSKVDVSLRYF
jgi:hypothetical protein